MKKMGRSDEYSLGLIGSMILQAGGGGKINTTATTGPTRTALSTVNENIIGAPFSTYAVNERSLSESDGICNKPPMHRPITRKFAAQLADQKPQIRDEETKQPDSVVIEKPERIVIDVDECDEDTKKLDLVSSEETERTVIDVDDSDKEERGDFNEPMLEEIDQMEETELEDADKEEERVIDIDACDEENPLAVVEYLSDMFTFYRKLEELSCVPPNYMDNQPDLNEGMRGILDDWLIEVHYKFELMEETLYQTINVIDRFLAVHQIVRKKLQLVGVTALLLACKYEEVLVPVVDDLILITDKAYTRKEVLDMETLMANTLQFNFSLPTPYVFVKRFLKAAQSDRKLEVLSLFMIDLCLVEYEMLEYLPSKLAASAIYTAQCTLKGFEEWNKTCEFHTGYREEQLLACARKMVAFHDKAGTGKLTGVHRKYNTIKFCHAARTEPAWFLL